MKEDAILGNWNLVVNNMQLIKMEVNKDVGFLLHQLFLEVVKMKSYCRKNEKL